MKFFNDLWQLKKSELASMETEHWGIYFVLGIGLICLCACIYFSRDDDNEL